MCSVKVLVDKYLYQMKILQMKKDLKITVIVLAHKIKIMYLGESFYLKISCSLAAMVFVLGDNTR